MGNGSRLSLNVGSWARSLTSPGIRAKVRRNPLFRRFLKSCYGGIQHRRHPLAPYDLYFDGYRNLGWSTGGLAETEVSEMQFVAKLHARRPQQCAWDIGANVGLWTLFIAGCRPSIQRIISFEPDPTNLQLLRTNCEKNKLDRVQLRDVALSSAPGEMVFYADSTTGSTGSLEKSANFIEQHYSVTRNEVVTRVSTIDAEIAAGLPPPGLMKIDVEGHELSVLQGAGETLARYHPAILLEATREQDEVGRLLKSHGYLLYDPTTGAQIDQPGFATAAVMPGEN